MARHPAPIQPQTGAPAEVLFVQGVALRFHGRRGDDLPFEGEVEPVNDGVAGYSQLFRHT